MRKWPGDEVINAASHEWSTLTTALHQLQKLNELVNEDISTPICVWLDMDLYKRALKLPYLDEQYRNKWILDPGQFNTVLCALRCLGQTVDSSGLDEAWAEAVLVKQKGLELKHRYQKNICALGFQVCEFLTRRKSF